MTRQILWLDSDSTRPSHDSTLTRLEKNSDDSDSKGLWLDKYDLSTLLVICGPMFPLRCTTAQYQQTVCAVKSHSGALATFKMRYCVYIAPLKTLHWLCAWAQFGGGHGRRTPHFFRRGDIICHVPHNFLLGFVFGEVSNLNVTFCVKSFSC